MVNTINPQLLVNKIIHNTCVDFAGRKMLYKKIHLVQYDDRLPIIAVTLYKDGLKYALPQQTTTCKVRWGKKDNTFVIKDVLGCSEDRTIVYFDISVNIMKIF